MLDGAKFVCLHENGEPYKTIEAKGRKFTIGYLMDCDHIIENAEAEKIHCQIECDAFGHVTIYNKSNKNPISVNGERVTMKRTLFNNSKITILDKEYLWQHKNSTCSFDAVTEGMLTPIKQIGIPEQPPSSCPALKHHLDLPQRFTMHNLRAYRVDSAANVTIEMGESSSQEESRPAKNATFELDTTPAKVDLVDSTKDKTTSSTEKRLKEIRNSFGFSGMATTSYSPRETGVRTEKTFIAIIPPKTRRGTLCRTPKGLLENIHLHGERNDTINNSEFLSFATPTKKFDGENRSEIIVQHARSAMKIVDLTTPSKLLTRSITSKKPTVVKSLLSDKIDAKSNISILQTTPKMTPKIQLNDTPTSTASIITVDSSSDLSEITEDTSAVTSTTTPLRSQLPISSILRKQVLLASAKKQVSMKTPHSLKTSANLSLPDMKAAATSSNKSCLSTNAGKSESVKDSKSDGIVRKNVARRLDILSTEQSVTPLKTQEIKLNEITSVPATSTPYKTQSIEEKNDSIQQDTGIELLSILHTSNDVEPLNTTKDHETLPEERGENDDLLKEIEEILNTSDELKKKLKNEINSNEPTSSSSTTDSTTSHSPPKSTTVTSPERKSIVNKTPAKNSITASIILKAISSIEKGNRESQKEDEEKENKINDCASNPTTPAARRRISVSAASPSVVAGTTTTAVNEENCIPTVTPLTPKRVSKRKTSLSVENEDSSVVNKSSHHVIDEFNTENMGAIVEEDTQLDSQNAQSSKVTPIKMTTQDELDESSIPETPMHQFKDLKVIKKAVNTPNEQMEDDIISLLHCTDESFAESVMIEEKQEEPEDKTIAVLSNEPKNDVVIESNVLKCNATEHQIGKEQIQEGNTPIVVEERALELISANHKKSGVEETLNECFAFEILDTSSSDMPEKVQPASEGKVSPQLFDEETADRVEGIVQMEDNPVEEHNLNKTFEKKQELLVNESGLVASIETETEIDDVDAVQSNLSIKETCKSNDVLLLENKNASKSNIIEEKNAEEENSEEKNAEEKNSTFTEKTESEGLENKEEAEILFEDEHLTLTEADEIEEPSIIADNGEESTFKNSNEKSENVKIDLNDENETNKTVNSSENDENQQAAANIAPSKSIDLEEIVEQNKEATEKPIEANKSKDEGEGETERDEILSSSEDKSHQKPEETTESTPKTSENLPTLSNFAADDNEILLLDESLEVSISATGQDPSNIDPAKSINLEEIVEQNKEATEMRPKSVEANKSKDEAEIKRNKPEDIFEILSSSESENEELDESLKKKENRTAIKESIRNEIPEQQVLKSTECVEIEDKNTSSSEIIPIEFERELLEAVQEETQVKESHSLTPIMPDEDNDKNIETIENQKTVEQKATEEDICSIDKQQIDSELAHKPEEASINTLSIEENVLKDDGIQSIEVKKVDDSENSIIDELSGMEERLAFNEIINNKKEETQTNMEEDMSEFDELNAIEESLALDDSIELINEEMNSKNEIAAEIITQTKDNPIDEKTHNPIEEEASAQEKTNENDFETSNIGTRNIDKKVKEEQIDINISKQEEEKLDGTSKQIEVEISDTVEVKEKTNENSKNVEPIEDKAIQKSKETIDTTSEILAEGINDATEKKEETSIPIKLNDIEEIVDLNKEEIQSTENLSNSIETNKSKYEGGGETERDDKSLQKPKETIDSTSENLPTLSNSTADDNEILLLDESLEVSISATVQDENHQTAGNIAPSKSIDLEEIVEQNKEATEKRPKSVEANKSKDEAEIKRNKPEEIFEILSSSESENEEGDESLKKKENRTAINESIRNEIPEQQVLKSTECVEIEEKNTSSSEIIADKHPLASEMRNDDLDDVIDDATDKKEETSIPIKLNDIEEIVDLNKEKIQSTANLSNLIETNKSKDEGEGETERDEILSSSENKSHQKPEETTESTPKTSENLPTLSNFAADDNEILLLDESLEVSISATGQDPSNIDPAKSINLEEIVEKDTSSSEIIADKHPLASEIRNEDLGDVIDDAADKTEETSIPIKLNDIEEIVELNKEEIKSTENLSDSVETKKSNDEGEAETERDEVLSCSEEKSFQKPEEITESTPMTSENLPTLSNSPSDDNEILLLEESLEVSISATVQDKNEKACVNTAPSILNDFAEIEEQNKEELELAEPEVIDEEQNDTGVSKELAVEQEDGKDNQDSAMYDMEDIRKLEGVENMPSSSDVVANQLDQSDKAEEINLTNSQKDGTTNSVESIEKHSLVSKSDVIQQEKPPHLEGKNQSAISDEYVVVEKDEIIKLNDEKNKKVSLGSGDTIEEQVKPVQDDKNEAEMKKKSLEEVKHLEVEQQEITTLPKVFQEDYHEKEIVSDTSANLGSIKNDKNLKDQEKEVYEMDGKSIDDKIQNTNEDDGQKKEDKSEEITTTTHGQQMENLLEVSGDEIKSILDSMKSLDTLDDKDQSGDTKAEQNITQETTKTPEDTSVEISKSPNKVDQNDEATNDQIPTRSHDTQRNVVKSLEFSEEDTTKEKVNQGDSQTLSQKEEQESSDASEKQADNDENKETHEKTEVQEKKSEILDSTILSEEYNKADEISEAVNHPSTTKEETSELKTQNEREKTKEQIEAVLDEPENKHSDQISCGTSEKKEQKPRRLRQARTKPSEVEKKHEQKNLKEKESSSAKELDAEAEKKNAHSEAVKPGIGTKRPRLMRQVRAKSISIDKEEESKEKKEKAEESKLEEIVEDTEKEDQKIISDEAMVATESKSKSDEVNAEIEVKKPRRVRQVRAKSISVDKEEEPKEKKEKAEESKLEEIVENTEKEDQKIISDEAMVETESKSKSDEVNAEIEVKKPRRVRQVRAKSISVDKEEEPKEKKEKAEESKLEEIVEDTEKEDQKIISDEAMVETESKSKSDEVNAEIEVKKPRRVRQVRAKSISVDKEEEPKEKKEKAEESKLEEIVEDTEKEDQKIISDEAMLETESKSKSDEVNAEIEVKKPRRVRQVRAKSISVDKEEEPKEKKEKAEESKLEEIVEDTEKEDQKIISDEAMVETESKSKSDEVNAEIEVKKPRRVRQVRAKSISVDKEEEPKEKKEKAEESKLEEIVENTEKEDQKIISDEAMVETESKSKSDEVNAEIEVKKPRRVRQVRAKSISVDKEEEPKEKKEKAEESKLEEIVEDTEKEDQKIISDEAMVETESKSKSDEVNAEIEVKKPRCVRQIRAKSISVDKEEEPKEKKEKAEESKLEEIVEGTEKEDQKIISDEGMVETESKSKKERPKQKSMKVQKTRNEKQARSTKKKPNEEEEVMKEETIREEESQEEIKEKPKKEQTIREDENEAEEAQIIKVVEKEEDNEEQHKPIDITQPNTENILDVSTQQRSLRRRAAVHIYEMSSGSENETQQTPSRKRRIGKANQKQVKTNSETKDEIDTTANTSKATIQRGGRKKQLTTNTTSNEGEKPPEDEEPEIPKKRARNKAEPKSTLVKEQLLHDTIESKEDLTTTISEVEEPAASKVQKGRKQAVRGRAAAASASKHEDEKPKGKQNKVEKDTIIKEVENTQKESKPEPEPKPELETSVRPSSRRGAKKVENITEVLDLKATTSTPTTPKRTAARRAKNTKVQDESFLYEEPGKKRGRAKKTTAVVEGKEEAKTSTADNDNDAVALQKDEEEVKPKSIAKRKGKTTKDDTTSDQIELPVKRARRQSEVQQEDTAAPIELAADNKTKKPSVEQHVEEKKGKLETTRTGRQRKLTESDSGESNIIEKRRKLTKTQEESTEGADDLAAETSVITKKTTRGRTAKQKDTTTDGVVVVAAATTSRRKQTKAQKDEMEAAENSEKTLTISEEPPEDSAVDNNTTHTHPDEETTTKRGRGRPPQRQVNTPAGVVAAAAAESTKTPTQRSQRRKHVHFDEVHVTADEETAPANEVIQYENKEVDEKAETTSSTSRSKRRRK